MINYQYADVMITGLRKGEFGLRLCFQGGKQAGIMEYMPLEERIALYGKLEVISEDDKFIFIEPIPCRIKYRNLTRTGLLRLPSFVKWNYK